MRRCPNCGASVPDNSLTCPKCYSEVHRTVKTRRGTGDHYRRPENGNDRKSGNIALLLAVLPGLVGLWGLGHIYLGERGRGLRFLAGGVTLSLLIALMGSTSFLVFTVVCLVFLALLWLAAFGYHLVEVIALIAAKDATPPHRPF